MNVAHVWQLDPDSGIPLEQRRTVCAPAVVNIVLDFMLGRNKEQSFDIKDIIEQMYRHGGKVEGTGWRHCAGVGSLKENGLIAWRRNWHAPSQDPSHFMEHEGYDSGQVEKFLEQLKSEEHAGGSVEEKALHSIKESINKGCPVIASVTAGFSENEGYHQVVISGYGVHDGHDKLDIVDPLLPPGKPISVDVGYFLKYYKLQSIFVRPGPSDLIS